MMFGKIRNFILRHEVMAVCVLLGIVVLISYGKTINMYWWVDDWGLLFKMIHPSEVAGNLGYGIWGSGAYRFLATPFIFLYPLFGTNAQPYFILGLTQYLVAAIVVYFFVKELTENRLIALGSSVIFAAGYIGSFAIYRLSNSYQLSDTTIFIYLSGYFLIRYLKQNNQYNYLLSLAIYVAAIIFMFLRAHGIIVVVFSILISWVLINWKKEKGRVIRRLVELLPFILSYFYFYFMNYKGGGESGGFSNQGLFQVFINSVFVQRNFFLINNLFYSFSSLVIPNVWVYSFYDFLHGHFSTQTSYIVSGDALVILVGYVFFIFSLLAPFVFKNYRKYLLYLPLASFFILGNIFTYFVDNPLVQLESYNRYLVTAFVGSTVFYSSLFFTVSELLKRLIKNSAIVFYLLVAVLSLSFINLSYRFQNEILTYISYPTQQAYRVIKSVVQKVDESTVFFIDTEDEPRVKNNVLAGMGELGVSIFYNYDGVTKFVNSYDELYSKILSGNIDLNNFYTFFASEKQGFVPTTNNLKRELYQKLEPKVINGWDYSNEVVFIDTKVNYPSLMPTALTLTLSLKPEIVISAKVPIKIWWMTERRNTYQLFYTTDLDVYADGLPHTYTVYISAGGLNIQNLRIDGYTEGSKIKVLNSSIVNLTLPELKGKNIVNN